MIIEKFQEIIPFKQSKWLEMYISFKTKKKQNGAKKHYEKDFYKLLKKAAFGKMKKNIRNRLGLEKF